MADSSASGPIPNTFADFEADPRIHFNTISQKWETEDDDGNEMEWDATKNVWVPLVSGIIKIL
jgi:HIV Tat-specific factor 1